MLKTPLAETGVLSEQTSVNDKIGPAAPAERAIIIKPSIQTAVIIRLISVPP